jgi:carboxyl-terminal processing protease
MDLDRRAVIGAAGLLAFPLGMSMTSACARSAPSRPFDEIVAQVRKLVEHHHYSRGQDTAAWRAWRADAEIHQHGARSARTTPELYLSVLMPMVGVFGDAHTFILPPPAASPAQASASPPKAAIWNGDIEAGQGFGMATARNGLWVTRVIEGSLADRNEIEPGSKILSYNLQSRRAQPPRLTLRLEGGVRDLQYDLASAPADPPVSATPLSSGRTLLRFDRFDSQLTPSVVEALRTAGAAGVVLDLRRNGGGDSNECRHLMGVLIGDKQPIATLIEGRRRTVWRTQSSTPAVEIPLAVLVGPTTSSAAEVIAANLQERGRAIVVGEATAGAVLMAGAYGLKDGGVLSVAEKDVLTPKGRRLEGAGVQPDQTARQTLSAVRAKRDLVVEAAEARLNAVPSA